jgi:hypothetical protein
MVGRDAETYAAARHAAKAAGSTYVWEQWETVRHAILTYADARHDAETYVSIGGVYRDEQWRAARRVAQATLVACIWAAEANSAATKAVDEAYATAQAHAAEAFIIWNDDDAYHGFDSTHDFEGAAAYEAQCANFAATQRARYYQWMEEILLELLQREP